MTILNQIVENTKTKLVQKKTDLPIENILNQLKKTQLPKANFKNNIIGKDQAIIAEIKKASPSAGIIDTNFDPVKKAKEYESFGASALSILTEEDYFQGSVEYLKDVKKITNLPILRKDFTVDEYQIYEAKLIGADCILLIASVLDDVQIKDFVNLAEELELDYLIEVHDLDELKRVQAYKNAIIGVNNRNLKTFEVDIENSINLSELITENFVKISESGISSAKEISILRENGFKGFLIGETFMKEKNPGKEVLKMINEIR